MRYPFDKYRLGTRYGAKGRFWKAGWHSGQDFISISFGGDGLVYPLYAGEVLRVAVMATVFICAMRTATLLFMRICVLFTCALARRCRKIPFWVLRALRGM